MQTEDIYTFYRDGIEPEFAAIWSEIVDWDSDSSNVRIECIDGQYYHSDQSLLSISSQCFRDAFHYYYTNRSHELPTDEELVISLPYFVSFEDLKSILDYIHKGIVSIPESRVNEFLDIAKFLAIKGLEAIQLVYLNEMYSNLDFKYILLVSKQWTSIRGHPNYVLDIRESEESDESEDLEELENSEDYMDYNDWDNSSDFYPNSDSYTMIKELPNEEIERKDKHLIENSLIPKTSMMSKIRRVGLQGRRPQIGSPLITEEFRFGDRYQCKVCLRSYLWKKSLVRHYRDLHPNNVQLVTA